ncbi:MAG: hypothetical protein IT285_05740 [Bdellovibrionales bacterium]|nr:hypothetical protein [Bdellovibrionales bacterium]
MSQDDSGFKPADLVRRILTIGVGAVFLTEESIKALVKQYKIPAELIGGLMESANRTKSEFLRDLSDKMTDQFMQKVDVRALAKEILEDHEMEITVKFRPAREGKKASKA